MINLNNNFYIDHYSFVKIFKLIKDLKLVSFNLIKLMVLKKLSINLLINDI